MRSKIVSDGQISSAIQADISKNNLTNNVAEKTSPFDLLKEVQAAVILDTSVGTLQVWRSTGRYQIPFIKIGRNVRYRRKDLEDWLESRTRSTGATADEA